MIKRVKDWFCENCHNRKGNRKYCASCGAENYDW